MANKKVVSVLSTAAIGTLIASAVGTTALAKVDGLVVKNAEGTYLNYDLTELQESAVENYLGNEEGAVLYKSFDAARANLVSYHDDKTGFIDAKAIAEAAKDAILNGEEFDVNKFTEASKETALPGTVYKAVVKDGVVVKGEEVKPNGDDDDQDEDLKVVSVKSINAAQVKVTFNRALTEDERDEAEDLDNYTLNNSKGDEVEDVFADVDVEEGSKEAILTVDYNRIGDDDDDYQNQASYKLVLDENITGTEVSKEFKVSDFEIPEVTSVEVVGIRTIKVKLSEPIVAKKDKELKDTFEINDEEYSIDKVTSINNGTELNIELYSDLEDGEELTVDVKSEAEDYAGYSLKKAQFKTKVNFDKSDLVIEGYKKAKDREITLVFNKDVKFADYEDYTKIVAESAKNDPDYEGFKNVPDNDDVIKSFYHTTSKNTVEAVEIDGNEVTLYFGDDYQLPETAYVFVDADVLQDLWEKENDDLNIKVNVVKDNQRPEIKKIEQDEDSNYKIIITFNEDIEKKSSEDKGNYTVKDKDGKELRISKAEKTDDDEVTLTLSKELEDGDKYEVTVEDVEDKAGNKISKVTKTFTAKETQAVKADDITVRYYDAGKSNQKIVVDFDTKMLADGSRYAINNLENYDLTVDGVTVNLGDYDGASIKAVEGNKKAEIKLPGNIKENNKDDKFNFAIAKQITLDINKVDDANGNRTNVIKDLEVKAKGEIGLDDDIVAIDTETIKMVLEDEVDFENSDVEIGYYDASNKWNKIVPSSTKVEKKDGVTTVTYKLKEKDQLAYNGKYQGKYDLYINTVSKTESENRYGDTLKAGVSKDPEWKVLDKIAPALALIDEDEPQTIKYSPEVALDDRDDYEDAVRVVKYNASTNTATIELIFEEDIDTKVNPNMFKTDDSDVKVKSATVNGNVLTLEVKANDDDYDDAEDFVGLEISSGSNEIFDLAEDVDGEPDPNGAAFTTEVQLSLVDEEKMDTVAPVISGAKDVTLKVGDEFDPTEGVTATDDVDGSVDVRVTGKVDTSKSGKYEITYTAIDKAGNKATKTITVTVTEPVAVEFTGELEGVEVVNVAGSLQADLSGVEEQTKINEFTVNSKEYANAKITNVKVKGANGSEITRPVDISFDGDGNAKVKLSDVLGDLDKEKDGVSLKRVQEAFGNTATVTLTIDGKDVTINLTL